MSFADSVWKLERIAPGFSQRLTGRPDQSVETITRRWASSNDLSVSERDVDTVYERISR